MRFAISSTLLSVIDFGSPGLAVTAAAVAVAVPVLLHLLFKQTPRPMKWAAMRFLPASPLKHRRRIEHFPLLMMRILALVLPLVAMLAVLPGWERVWQQWMPGELEVAGRGPRTHTVIVLDASLSMTAAAEMVTRFERVKAQMLAAVDAAGPADAFIVIVLGASAEVRIGAPSNRLDVVRAEIDTATPVHAAGDLAAALAAAGELLKKPGGYARRRVLVATDLQKTAFNGLLPRGDGVTPEIWSQLTGRAEVVFIDVAGRDAENLAITQLEMVEAPVFLDADATVRVAVKNAGKAVRNAVAVDVALARPTTSGPSALVIIGRVLLESIPPGATATGTLTLANAVKLRDAGPHLLKASLAVSDAMPVDDERYFAFEVRDALTVLVVNGKPSPRSLRGSADFLAEALAPSGRVSPNHPVRVKVIRTEEFADAGRSDLSGVDSVVLCDVASVSRGQVERLQGLLARGGGVIVTCGPNTLAAAESLNRAVEPLLPGTLGTLRTGEGEARFTAADDVWRSPPLAAFSDDVARAGLTGVPIRNYQRLKLNADATAVLSFTESESGRPDTAIAVVARGRGRVAVVATTVNRDWTDWPVLPSFPAMMHELLKHVTANTGGLQFHVGEPITLTVPQGCAGQSVTLTGADGIPSAATVGDGDSVRFPERWQAGALTLTGNGVPGRPVAVELGADAERESTLAQLTAAELTALHPGLRVIDTVELLERGGPDEAPALRTPRPRGPRLAQWATLAAVAALVMELIIAWRLGPARRALASREARPVVRRSQRFFRFCAGALAFGIAVMVAMIVLQRAMPNAFLQLPTSMRIGIEQMLDVPRAGAGEGIRWQLAATPAWTVRARFEMVTSIAVFLALSLAAVLLYRREAPAAGGWSTLRLPLAMRIVVYAGVLAVLLPQLKLVFERESQPDVVVLIDHSASMATPDGAGGEAMADLRREWDLLPESTRLQVALSLAANPNAGLIARLIAEKRVRVQVQSVAQRAMSVGTATAEAREDAVKAVTALQADGTASHLGEGVEAVVKSFRGGALAAIVLVTDGITTNGPGLGDAGRVAGRAGVPLFIIGLGDGREADDLAVSDLRADDTVAKNDEWIAEAHVRRRGAAGAGPVTVKLMERKPEGLAVLERTTVTPPTDSAPATVRFKHAPKEPGERTFVIEAEALGGEADVSNNRVEKTVLVTESRKLRVLLVDGRARYEFRFLKVLFEREIERPGERSLEMKFFLADASRGFAASDRSALATFPGRAELNAFDVVILGDVDPAELPKTAMADLADFVRVRGGGLLMVAGEQVMPMKILETPLADLLPVTVSPTVLTPETMPLVDGYQLKLTPLGRQHPLFRLASDQFENERLWQKLQPMHWALEGLTPKLSAEVLAVHPAKTQPGSNEPLPLVLQQFAGAGRVMLFAFDESWRWRFRQDEELFNRFWRQAVRVLARNRLGRVELRTERAVYRRDEPVVVTAQFPDDAPLPAGDVRIEVERVEGRERELLKLMLAKQPGARGQYAGSLTRTPPGAYRFRYADESGPRATTEARVLPPPGERDRHRRDDAEMTRAAAASQGRYYTLETLATLLDDLPDGDRLPLDEPCPPLVLWNHPLAFLALLMLLGGEWILRKSARLL